MTSTDKIPDLQYNSDIGSYGREELILLVCIRFSGFFLFQTEYRILLSVNNLILIPWNYAHNVRSYHWYLVALVKENGLVPYHVVFTIKWVYFSEYQLNRTRSNQSRVWPFRRLGTGEGCLKIRSYELLIRLSVPISALPRVVTLWFHLTIHGTCIYIYIQHTQYVHLIYTFAYISVSEQAMRKRIRKRNETEMSSLTKTTKRRSIFLKFLSVYLLTVKEL